MAKAWAEEFQEELTILAKDTINILKLVDEDQDTATLMFLPTVKNAVKILLIICAIIIWLENLGFQVTTLIAGLGVGSVAIALAAQKSIENFIGAITLYTSQPVHVGDFCRFNEFLGTVEQIGLRATRIRTLDHSIVTVQC